LTLDAIIRWVLNSGHHHFGYLIRNDMQSFHFARFLVGVLRVPIASTTTEGCLCRCIWHFLVPSGIFLHLCVILLFFRVTLTPLVKHLSRLTLSVHLINN
jgi:hypothetical protein